MRTKGDDINLFTALSQVDENNQIILNRKLGVLSGAKFGYVITRNFDLLKPEYLALMKALEPLEEFVKYDGIRVELAKSHSKKDDKGEPEKKQKLNPQGKVISEEFILEDREAFEVAFEALKEEHKAVLDAREAQVKEQNELLKTESTITLHKVALADVPNNITAEQMKSIADIITDEVLSPFNK